MLRVAKAEKPLKFYEDPEAFKLFLLDLGLLGALSDAAAGDALVNNKAFTEYKGAFTEQYALQELTALDYRVYYHSREPSELKNDFIMQKQHIYHIEVKAEENLKAKSLRTTHSSNNSLKPLFHGCLQRAGLVNVPLYLAGEWINNAE